MTTPLNPDAGAQTQEVREFTYTIPCPYCHGRGLISGSRNWVAQGWTEAACYHCGTTGRVEAEKYRCAIDDCNCEGALRVPNAGSGSHRVLCGWHAATDPEQAPGDGERGHDD